MTKAKRLVGKHEQAENRGIAATDADTIIGLVEAAMGADFSAVRRAGSQLVRRFSEEGQPEHATRLRGVLRKRSAPLRTSGHVQELPLDGRSRLPLVDENPLPSMPVLMEVETEAVVTRFVEDALHAERLSQAGIESGLRLILCGPPGTGKTLLAGHIAARLNKPFQVARLDATISSLLGDTAKNIRCIFDHVSERSGFVFLDEIDAIAKLRDDQREIGELKRVVNTLIQGLDDLDDQTVVIAATNHPGLLDPAVWRRFPYRVEMRLPGAQMRTELWRLFLAPDDSSDIPALLGAISEGLSPADIRELALGARRASVIGDAPVVIGDLVRCVQASRSGALAVPTGRALSGEDRRRLVSALLPFKMTRAQMGNLVGVSRQRVDEYVRGLGDRVNAEDREKSDGASTHS
ncbi:MAG: ATP-binding protein [Fulvimarina manganoxydans]|uniref:AAA family ATPase n=1 Tax=Fulvimarina manganoxydans TaxID=937218 RepID=UPI002356942B|nr:ATP-binding protein [Fulvimarina manganoxydans]MCK5934368.1 ATP-binding protein [Fulvimarina manganoxydans]